MTTQEKQRFMDFMEGFMRANENMEFDDLNITEEEIIRIGCYEYNLWRNANCILENLTTLYKIERGKI